MTSKDNTFEMSRMELLLREHFARIDKQFAEMKADNAEFKRTITDEMNKRFDGLQTQINAMQNDITGLKHDVANLQHWNYWILAIILAVFVLPHFASGVKTFFAAIRDGILGIMTLFKKVKQ